MDESQKQLVLDYQWFTCDAGKRVLDDIKTNAHYDRDIFVPGQPDLTVFRLGMREVYLSIKKAIEADPDAEIQENTQELAEMEVA